MYLTNEKIQPIPRKYYPADLDVNHWETVEKEWQLILATPITIAQDLIDLLEHATELTQIIGDEMSWRYIRMTQHADDEQYEQTFNSFYASIYSRMLPYSFELQKKFYHSPYHDELNPHIYGHLNRIISNCIEIYREENLPLKVKEAELSNKYGAIYGKMTVEYDGEERTLTQLATYLKNPQRSIREDAWRLRMNRLLQDKQELDELFNELKAVRNEMAHNASFANYRDYKHQEMGRFAYTPDDLQHFHAAVETAVLPFLRELNEHRKEKLQLDSVRPWDTQVDLDGKVLHPFDTTEEFVSKTIRVLEKVNPDYALQLDKMHNTGLLDLENRKGKAPGGYNNPLAELGSSFIFMNAVKMHRDVVTLLHESGHAMHAMSINHIPLDYYRETPSEVAELASMAMELISMENWELFYPDPEDFKKAKRDQLEGTLNFLPWCMMVDAFQHWVYTNPDKNAEDRHQYFLTLAKRFDYGVNWEGLDELRKISWMFQLHIFEVPFYYIEYGMAQLGALAIYKNYRQNGKKAIADYQNFLSLGYTKPVNELYQAAGIRFDFTREYLQELVDFVKEELKPLQAK
jgi:oligoendopeptidase F